MFWYPLVHEGILIGAKEFCSVSAIGQKTQLKQCSLYKYKFVVASSKCSAPH